VTPRSRIIDFVLSVLASRPGLRAGAIAIYILLVEWARALTSTAPGAATAVLLLGGIALVLAGAGWPAERLGLGRSRLGLRILGGFALAAVLLPVSYTHLRAHETSLHLVCRLLLEKK